MIRFRSTSAVSASVAATLAFGLSACNPPPPPTAQDRAAKATVSACRQRADEVYTRQNRASIYTPSDRDTPESGDYVSGITTRGLADRYGWDTQVSDCVRNQGSTDAAGTGFSPGPSPIAGSSRGPAR